MNGGRQLRYGLAFLALFFLAGPAMPMSKITSDKNEEKNGASILEDILMPDDLDEGQVKDWKNGVPPGWSKGKKTGWQGKSMPPGQAKKYGETKQTTEKRPPDWEKMKKKDRETWTERLEKIRERIRKVKKDQEAETMLFSAEEAAKAGIPLTELDSVTENFLKKQLTAEEYEKTTRAMAYGINRKIDFKQLGAFINTNIDQGTRGNELAIRIYKEIAARSGK